MHEGLGSILALLPPETKNDSGELTFYEQPWRSMIDGDLKNKTKQNWEELSKLFVQVPLESEDISFFWV